MRVQRKERSRRWGREQLMAGGAPPRALPAGRWCPPSGEAATGDRRQRVGVSVAGARRARAERKLAERSRAAPAG